MFDVLPWEVEQKKYPAVHVPLACLAAVIGSSSTNILTTVAADVFCITRFISGPSL